MIKVFRDLEHLPVFINAVITIGTFDGVHIGHQQIIHQLKQEALAIGGETVIITFHPHPRKIVGSQVPIRIINTLNEKIELLQEAGIENLVVIPFNETFANQSPEAYIQDFLVDKFHPHTIIIGYDHKFGKNRQGDYHLLEDKAMELGFIVKEIPEHLLNELIVSSTRVREALLNSDIETANKYLGYPYFFEGLVVEGNKLGRTIGYPTANLFIENIEKLVPGNSVYAVKVQQTNTGAVKKVYYGMMNIGNRPTVDGNTRTIEVNIFDFDQNLYGQTLQVRLLHRLRGEIKFKGLDELKAQLANDEKKAREVMSCEL